MELRPCESATSMASRWTSQALADGLRLGCIANSAPKSVVTSLAGFAESGLVLTPLPGIAGVESVAASSAGFAERFDPRRLVAAARLQPLSNTWRQSPAAHLYSFECAAATIRAAPAQ